MAHSLRRKKCAEKIETIFSATSDLFRATLGQAAEKIPLRSRGFFPPPPMARIGGKSQGADLFRAAHAS